MSMIRPLTTISWTALVTLLSLGASPVSVEGNWTLLRTVCFDNLQAAHLSPGTDCGQGLNTATTLPLNVWSHCVAVADRHAGGLKLHRNGQLPAHR